MVENVNGGLVEAAAKPVGAGCDDTLPAHERIARLIEADTDAVLADPEPAMGRDDDSVTGPTPRTFGFDVREINRNYALTIWGGKAVVVNEQPSGPVNDSVRVMSFESMNSWFANRLTEIAGSDGKIRAITWARAWHAHPERRQYDGVEFWPNPDGARGTPNYLNFWRGFDVPPATEGSYAIFRDYLLNQVCDGDPELFKYVFGWMAHIVQKPRERLGTAIVLRGKRLPSRMPLGKPMRRSEDRFGTFVFATTQAPNTRRSISVRENGSSALWTASRRSMGRSRLR